MKITRNCRKKRITAERMRAPPSPGVMLAVFLPWSDRKKEAEKGGVHDEIHHHL